MTNEEYKQRWPELWEHRLAFGSKSRPARGLTAVGLEELVDLAVGDMNPSVRPITPGSILDAVLANLQGFAARGVFLMPNEEDLSAVLNWRRLAERAEMERRPTPEDDDFLGFEDRLEPQPMNARDVEALIPFAIKSIDCIGLDVTPEAIRDEVIEMIGEVVAQSEFTAPSEADIEAALDLCLLKARADRHCLVASAPASPGMH